MSQDFFKRLFSTFSKAFTQVKTALSHDYSMQDLKKISALPAYLWQRLQSLKALTTLSQSQASATQTSWNAQRVMNLLLTITHYRKQCISLLILGILLVANTFFIAPYGQRLQDQLEMRPAQWSALQSLVRLSKQATASPSLSLPSLPGLEGASGVAVLDEMEVQKLRNLLTARGLKPNVLRLTADNPPQVEFQASDVMFSVLLDALEELRTGWRLYPDKLNIVSGAGAGVVNISGVLVQYGRQVETVR